MDGIVSVVSSLSVNDAPANLDYAVDPCLSCTAPCAEGHAEFPESLAKTIDQSCLMNSIKPYKRHLMFCGGSGPDWPSHLEEELSKEAFLATIEDAVKTGGKSAGRTIVSAIDRTPEGDSEGTERVDSIEQTEVFLFPDYKGLRGVTTAEASTVVSDWVSKGVVPSEFKAPSVAEIVDLDKDAYVFVCVHKKRDKRCGITGPIIIEEINQVLSELGLSETVSCIGISHIGGHKFAGNVIIYSKKFPQGVWYGRVIPCHVENIIKQTVVEGKVFKELFRGQGTV
ncbi:hypothetical protein HDU98_000903 [Podochytrium sp. JEL0797]|nr:hypothetical protein HDU98_000903 [Podochytrium sp. JEL0797]